MPLNTKDHSISSYWVQRKRETQHLTPGQQDSQLAQTVNYFNKTGGCFGAIQTTLASIPLTPTMINYSVCAHAQKILALQFYPPSVIA
jgi:hypothetical protein